MLDRAHYDRHGRRALAEAQGWSIRKIASGASAVFPPGASDWTLASHDGDEACIKGLPDPLRDDADFARLIKFLWAGGVEVQFGTFGKHLVVRLRWKDVIGTSGIDRLKVMHHTNNAALVSAALAWLDAKGEGAKADA